MLKLKLKERAKMIISLCLVVILSISTFVITGVALGDDQDTTITWDFATPQINNDAGNELRYSTLEDYIAVGKLSNLEGLVSSSGDGSEFVFDSVRYPGLMARVTGNFVAHVAYDSPITIVVDLVSDADDMRPIIQAAPTPNGPWVNINLVSDPLYEKGTDNKYPAGKYTFSTDGIGAGNCYVKYTIPSERQESLHIWTWHKHRLQTFTFEKSDGSEPVDDDIVNWDFSPYTSWKQSVDLPSIIDTANFPGLVSSGVNSASETWIVDAGVLMVVGTGRLVIKTAENSPFTAIFADSGSGLRPTVQVGASANGPWTTVEPTYTKNADGKWVLNVDNIGEGNCYVQYVVSGTTWSSYWNHKLSSVSFKKWKEPEVANEKIEWDFTKYSGQTKNLISITGQLEGLANSWCDTNGTWMCGDQGLQAVISGSMIINMADNSSFTAVFADSGSGLRPTVRVGASSNGPWTTVEPTYTKNADGKWVLNVDNIGEGNCYVQYVVSGTTWSSYWNHKLLTVTFEKYVEPETPEVDDSHLPKCDTEVVFNKSLNTTYWDFRECFKVSSNMFFGGIEGGVFPNTMPYEGGKPFVTMRVGSNSPVVVCYSQKADKVPKFYVSPNGEDWDEIKPDLTDTNSKKQKRAIFYGIGSGNMFFKFEFPQDNSDMINSMGWIVTLESISYKLAGGIPSADTSGKVTYNFTKYSGQNKNLTTITGNLTGLINSWCDINGTWMCGNGGLSAVINGTLIFATEKNSPLEIVYIKSSDNVNLTVKVSESVGGPWKELDLQPVVDGAKYTLSTDAMGEGIGFVQISLTDTGWDNYYTLKLASVTFNALVEEEEVLPEGMKKINFVSNKWNQSFDTTKYPEIIGFNGAFVSDKPGYMRMDMDWSTFKINTDNKSSLDFVVAKNSSVVVNLTTRGKDLENRPVFYVSSNKKNWKKIQPTKIETVGEDATIGAGNYIVKYTFDGIGKDNIFFRFEFGVKKGEPYTLIGLRDITFVKNTTYVLPSEPRTDSAIIFDAQKNTAYYDFRACEDVTDNMFFGGNERGVFPCTATTTGHQPGIIIKVAKKSPIAVRYRDLGMGKKPIYAVSTDKKTWKIVECDWSDKDSNGDIVDVINSVGNENIYFRFEFPQTQKEFTAMQGWLLTLQSICYNEYIEEEAPETESTDTEITEKDDLDKFLESLKTSKTTEVNKPFKYILPICIISAVVVLGVSFVIVLLLAIKKKRRNK